MAIVGISTYSLLLRLHNSLEIVGHVLGLNSVLLHGVLSLIVPTHHKPIDRNSHQRGVEQSLGGDATNVQAGTSQSTALLNTSGLKTKLGGLDGGDITTGASSDYDNVKPKYKILRKFTHLSAAATLKDLAAKRAFCATKAERERESIARIK